MKTRKPWRWRRPGRKMYKHLRKGCSGCSFCDFPKIKHCDECGSLDSWCYYDKDTICPRCYKNREMKCAKCNGYISYMGGSYILQLCSKCVCAECKVSAICEESEKYCHNCREGVLCTCCNCNEMDGNPFNDLCKSCESTKVNDVTKNMGSRTALDEYNDFYCKRCT